MATFSNTTSDFLTPSVFDMNFTNSAFASPSMGGADIWTPTLSSEISSINTVKCF